MSLSADGRRLLFTEQGQGGGRAAGVYLREFDGSAVRLSDGRTTGLSHDGSWAVCFSVSVPSPYNEGLLVGRPGEGPASFGQVYRVDPATGHQTPWRNILPADRTGIMNFVSLQVTPDGQSQVYSWHRALSNLFIAEGLA